MSDPRPTLPDPLPAPLARVATPDLNAERLATLKRLLPDLFTAEGRLNPDELRRLADAQGTADAERYEFKWYGKQRSKRHAFTPSLAALAYDAKRSCRPEKAGGNAIIEGENLEVLKLLLPAYRGRVKCILIDPPYNTGKDFVYRDNYARDRKEYWEETGVTEQGVKVDTNTDTSGRFHSDWLSMMHSRLLLAAQLLSQDGVIAVSIDDNEIQNLLRLLDETFGEGNKVAVVTWEKGRKNDAKLFSVGHEYLVIYARDKNHLKEQNIIWREPKPGAAEIWKEYLRLKELHGERHDSIEAGLALWFSSLEKNHPSKKLSRYRRVDEHGPWRDRDISWPGGDGPRYPVLHPGTGIACEIPEAGWRFSKPEEMQRQISLGLVVFREDHTKPPFRKAHLKPLAEESVEPGDDDSDESEEESEDTAAQVRGTYIYKQSQVAVKFLKALMGSKVFNNPKDHSEIARLVNYVTQADPNAIVLDFFAGSGTTAHAVLELNAADNGNRRFILVQIPELTKEKSVPLRQGFKRISDITIERVKRVIEGYGDNPQPLDAGFRVYRLRPSYFPRCEWAPDPAKTEAENLAALDATLKAKEVSLTMQFDSDLLLEEVLLKQGFGFARTVERLAAEFPKNTVYQVRDGERGALVCLDAQLSPETVDALQKQKPDQRFVCLELALDTTRKWTLTQHLGDYLTAL